MLVPSARSNLPAAPIAIAGPGPTEPPRDGGPAAAERPPVPVTSLAAAGSSSELINTNLTEEPHDGDDTGGGDDDDYPASPSGPADPYANLDGAFGGYAADEPKPHSNQDAGLF